MGRMGGRSINIRLKNLFSLLLPRDENMTPTNPLTKKKESAPLRAITLVFLAMVLLTGLSGCIDVNITRNIVEKIQEGEEIRREDAIVLSEKDQEFEVEFQDGRIPSAEDLNTIGTKFFDNLSDPDQDTIDNLRTILHEENISLKTKVYKFDIVEGTDRLYVSVDPIFDSLISPQVGGYFEIYIYNGTGDLVKHEEQVQTENKKEKPYNFFPPKTDISPGDWRVEIRGTGLQSFGGLAYSGKFDIEVHAHQPVSQ